MVAAANSNNENDHFAGNNDDATEIAVSGNNDDDEETPMIGKYTVDALLQRAKEVVAERTAEWEIVSTKAEERIPKFHLDEIELGQVYGRGGFFVVSEVKGIHLRPGQDDDDDGDAEVEVEELPFAPTTEKTSKKGMKMFTDENYIHSVVQDRKFMAKHCVRNVGNDCRYALKTMQPNCRDDPSKFVDTVVDMVIEFKFLSAVRHPNIIKMRAMSAPDLFSSGGFLILDRLYDTLLDRIKQWNKRDHNPFGKLFDFQKKREKGFMAERLTVAYDISSALCYLHDLNIIYRDLKPNNIGFDVRGDAKLFDFGLATEFDAVKNKYSGSYTLTGDTGTVRYMAPEVAQNLHYTELADVYSFGILLWEICAMEKPYGETSDDQVHRKVVFCGHRPKIDPKWPNAIRRLLQDCFASSPRRPTMEAIQTVLRREINQLSPEDKKLVDDDIVDSARSAMSARYYQ